MSHKRMMLMNQNRKDRKRINKRDRSLLLTQLISLFENEILSNELSIKDAEMKLSTLSRLKLALKFENESLTSTVFTDLKSWSDQTYLQEIA